MASKHFHLSSSQARASAAVRTCGLAEVLAQALLPDAVETAAGYGQWWFDGGEMQMVLSTGAARFLDVPAGLHPSLGACLVHVVPEDLPPLLATLKQLQLIGASVDCEFRVLHGATGLRWLRMQTVAAAPLQAGVRAGVMVDITSSKQLAMREHFSYAVTQCLVGADSLQDAVPKVIQLMCENLGWEWGAYWAIQHGPMHEPKLACRYYWSQSEQALGAFTRDSCAVAMAPSEGFVGQIWSSGKAAWIENMKNDAGFVRRASARACGLESGYAFPVTYVAEDGQRHSVGVLEFFSTLSRQQDAELPNLSAVIGALIAQAVQRMEQQEAMRRLAQTDDLTGLANRSHFHHQLEAMCLRAGGAEAKFALLYVDLDRFKPINDAYGHDAGNLVLREFAQRLQNLATAGAHLGRLGGDEFVMLQPLAGDDATQVQLQALAKSILLAASLPFYFEGNELKVSASIGISIFAENGWAPQDLLRSADKAMYRSKNSGRNAISFFSGSSVDFMEEQQTSLAIEAELHRALADGEFFLEYQPVFDQNNGRMVTVEALLRWRKPDGELVPPDVFIPIAEKSRLIVQVGRWVVRQACHDLALLHSAGFAGLKVNVNMAAAEFTNISLPYELVDVIGACGIAARDVCLELTEGMVMKQQAKVIPIMHMLRQLGFEISLDDFGIGHSSLSRLKQLPITSLKIDRSFIAGLPHDRGDGAIVRTILDLGRHMKIAVVAEGIETDAQLLYLAQFGCVLGQGFLLSRPLPLLELIERHPPVQGSRLAMAR